MAQKQVKVAIVGAGVAGASTALYLASLGVDVTLYEKESSIISGPPFCHLHAGGNLYREISDEQCVKLLKQSIDFLRFYPFVVDYRPTVIVLPTTDFGTPEALLPRLKLLSEAYKKLIEEDPQNEVLGKADKYYRLYNREMIESLSQQAFVDKPQTADEWMIPLAKHIDLDKVQFPLILVQEYGLNLFRLASGLTLALESLAKVDFRRDTVVSNIVESCKDGGWIVSSVHHDTLEEVHYDYLVNAAGFRSGKIDDFVGVACKSMVEFKAAYVSQWKESGETFWPEVIFHGERGTPRGMGQFTPYPSGYFQLHGMTKEITLYEDGLVSNSTVSCQPHLKPNFMEKIEKSWSKEEIQERTHSAVKHLSQFIPNFSSAKVGSKPLFGAQQIPGSDPTLRVAEVSFPKTAYARCEIVKVSSILDMIDAIVKQLIAFGYLEASVLGSRKIEVLEKLTEEDVTQFGEKICQEREYPTLLAHRNMPKKV